MLPRHRIFVRSHAVLRAQRALEKTSYPRLQMTLIAALTGAFALLSSFVLLHQGIPVEPIRVKSSSIRTARGADLPR
jgi:hypothetical protein